MLVTFKIRFGWKFIYCHKVYIPLGNEKWKNRGVTIHIIAWWTKAATAFCGVLHVVWHKLPPGGAFWPAPPLNMNIIYIRYFRFPQIGSGIFSYNSLYIRTLHFRSESNSCRLKMVLWKKRRSPPKNAWMLTCITLLAVAALSADVTSGWNTWGSPDTPSYTESDVNIPFTFTEANVTNGLQHKRIKRSCIMKVKVISLSPL